MSVSIIWGLLGGSLGALGRALTENLAQNIEPALRRKKLWARSWPLSTFLVNLAGCFILGLITGYIGGHHLSGFDFWIGFTGGFTTFSTALVDATKPLVAHLEKLSARDEAYVERLYQHINEWRQKESTKNLEACRNGSESEKKPAFVVKAGGNLEVDSVSGSTVASVIENVETLEAVQGNNWVQAFALTFSHCLVMAVCGILLALFGLMLGAQI